MSADTVGLLDHSTNLGHEVGHARRLNAWATAVRRLGFDGKAIGALDPEEQERFNRFVRDGAAAWMLSRASGVALTLAVTASETDEAGGAYLAARQRHEWHLEGQRSENERRDLATPYLLSVALMAYVESRYVYARQLAKGIGSSYMVEHLVGDESHPSYTEMRGFLVGELDARYVDACAAAFWRVAFHNRSERNWREIRHHWGDRRIGERGWL